MTTPIATALAMPIMKSKYITSMPMAMLDNNQAKKNHGQTLERLAARGGLASSEALAIMDGKHWGAYAVCDENDRLLSNRVKRFEEQQASLAAIRRCPYCAKLPEYNHRDGVPICKCTDKSCKGNERWLEYEEFEEQNKPSTYANEQLRQETESMLGSHGIDIATGKRFEVGVGSLAVTDFQRENRYIVIKHSKLNEDQLCTQLAERDKMLAEFATELTLAITDSQVRAAMTTAGRTKCLELLQRYNQ